MKNCLKHIVVAGLALAVLGMGMATAPASADPLKDRKAAMKSISKANKVIVGYTKGNGDLKAAVAAAKQIASIAKTIPSMFPKGSGEGYGKTTRAKPAVWKEWDKFNKASGMLDKAATNFVGWSEMGDASTLKAGSDGIRKACGGCHKAFRGPKPKKM